MITVNPLRPAGRWTDDRLRQLEEMRLGGMSAGQIGIALGVTRCAVLGIIFRAKRGSTPQGCSVVPRVEKAPGIRPGRKPRINSVVRPVPQKLQPRVVIPPLRGETDLMVVEETFTEQTLSEPPPEGGVDIFNLKTWQCRWPLGNTYESAKYFCAELKEDMGRPYCAHHRDIARRK